MSDIQQIRRTRRVTYTQLNNLWEYLNSHREIATGYNKSAQAREHSRQKWEEVASILNCLGEGATKSGPEWSKYWTDLKSKIKKKNRVINDTRRGTGGGPSADEELSDIERRFLSILGEDYGCGLPGVRVEPILSQERLDHEGTSQPVASEEMLHIPIEVQSSENETASHSVADEAVYLEIPSSENENEERSSIQLLVSPSPVISFPPNATSSTRPLPQPRPNIPLLVPPSPIISSPQTVPSPTQSQHQPQQEDPPVGRRRRRRRLHLTAAEAREQLVSSSRARADAELANSRSLERAVTCLENIAELLRRLEERLPMPPAMHP